MLYSQMRGDIMFKQLHACSIQIHKKVNLLECNSANCSIWNGQVVERVQAAPVVLVRGVERWKEADTEGSWGR